MSIAEEIQKALDERHNYGPFHHWLRWQQGEIERLRTELAEKDKVLEWYAKDGYKLHVGNPAQEILERYKKGDTKDA